MIPLVVGAGLAAGGMMANAWGAKRARQGAERAGREYDNLAREAKSQYGEATRTAGESRNRFLKSVYGFDPRSYAANAFEGDAAGINDHFGQAESRRRASLNSRGLLRSDIGGDRARQTYASKLAEARATREMQAADMEQRRQGMMGSIYGMDQGQANRFYDASIGLTASGIDRRNAGTQAGAAAWGAFGSGMMGLGGTVAGKWDGWNG